jgi:hypothetical protein
VSTPVNFCLCSGHQQTKNKKVDENTPQQVNFSVNKTKQTRNNAIACILFGALLPTLSTTGQSAGKVLMK